MNFRPQGFIEDDPEGIIKLNSLPARMPNYTIPSYPVPFDFMSQPIAELEKVLEEERLENRKLDEAWTYAERRYPEDCGNWPGKERDIPRSVGLAAYIYTLEQPANVYGEFNLQTRTGKNFLSVPEYKYKAFFVLLHKALWLDQTLERRKPVLYRGCSVKFGGVTNGDSITFRNFISTSESKQVAQYFLQGSSSVGTYFEIHDAIMGLSMADLSQFPQEKEFLLQPTEVFYVDDIQQIGVVRRIVLRSTHQTNMSI